MQAECSDSCLHCGQYRRHPLDVGGRLREPASSLRATTPNLDECCSSRGGAGPSRAEFAAPRWGRRAAPPCAALSDCQSRADDDGLNGDEAGKAPAARMWQRPGTQYAARGFSSPPTACVGPSRDWRAATPRRRPALRSAFVAPPVTASLPPGIISSPRKRGACARWHCIDCRRRGSPTAHTVARVCAVAGGRTLSPPPAVEASAGWVEPVERTESCHAR